MLGQLLLAIWLTCYPITWTWRWHWRIVASARLICPMPSVGKRVLTWCPNHTERMAYAMGYVTAISGGSSRIPYRRRLGTLPLCSAWAAGWWAGHDVARGRDGVAWLAKLSTPMHHGWANRRVIHMQRSAS